MSLMRFCARSLSSIAKAQKSSNRKISVATSAASYRMKIPLPLDNDTWFSFDENLTVYECLATMIEEDSHI